MTPRLLNRTIQAALDIITMSMAYWLAFLFRFEFSIPPDWMRVLLTTWPFVIVVQYAALQLFGVPRVSWRYISISDVGGVLLGLFTSAAVLSVFRLIGPQLIDDVSWLLIPLGVLAMNFVLALLGLIGIRALRRLHGEALDRSRQESGGNLDRVLLIGAGQAGVLVAREIARRPDLGLHPVGFLDDDPMKKGTSIGGLPVLGTTADLEAVAERKHVQRALITIANARGDKIRRITELCRNARVETKIIPGIYEIVGDKVNLSRIREVAIEDLLGREPVQLDEAIVSSAIGARVVLVTGAGGSIGSELCRQLCRFGPERLILVERFENALFEIHRELASTYSHLRIDPVIADVTDAVRMEQIFHDSKPDLVIHAAAHKHVPMMEWNPGEAVKNNVGGTRVLAHLADKFGVQRFVLVSTDKAVNPTSVMGATKRIAEIYTQAFSHQSQTKFVTVRFGNVLGSAGSVIPIFRDQIAKGGPIQVTHPEMRRYFMTIPEASQLVLQAGAMGEGGEIFILDMGEPVKIVDLARDLITLSGLRPDEDIEIRFSGVRAGEKLFEELSTDSEHADKTKHPKVFIGRIRAHAWESVTLGVDKLVDLANGIAHDRIRGAIGDLVPEYQSARPSSPSLPRVRTGTTEEQPVISDRKSGSSPTVPN